MHCLLLPAPVGRFLRRLFKVLSSLTISNQYFLLQKADWETGRDAPARQEAAHRFCENALERSEALLATRPERLADILLAAESLTDASAPFYSHWRLPKLWSTPIRQPVPLRQLRSVPLDEENHEDFDKRLPPPTTPPPSSAPPPPSPKPDEPPSPIQVLMLNPTLFHPILKPRFPIVLCHGLYGYDVRGPASFPKLQLHYWANVTKILKRKIGAEVLVAGVPGTGSIESRAERMDEFLREKARGQDVNFIAHSMGGLDCRHLISHVKPEVYRPASLTTLCTPHRGSPFMDWCMNNIGIGKLRQQAKLDGRSAPDVPNPPSAFNFASLPSSLTTLLLSVLDSPAYANLSTYYLEHVFNPMTPDDPRVRYYSVAARTSSISVWHPLWLPKLVLDGVEERERAQLEDNGEVPKDDWGNDGLVSVHSARWGEFLGTLEGCDHWDIRGSRPSIGGDGDWHMDLALRSPLAQLNVNWRDWGRLIGAWRKEEEQREEHERERERKEGRAPAPAQVEAKAQAARESEEAVLKSSTDKLSAVFDWVAEQIPLRSTKEAEAEAERGKEKTELESKDPRLKFDLERFYIALSRKLYDDGL